MLLILLMGTINTVINSYTLSRQHSAILSCSKANHSNDLTKYEESPTNINTDTQVNSIQNAHYV